MDMFTPADELHRLAKRAMDNGTAQCREEAEALLRGYTLSLVINPKDASDKHHQTALLTAVALGRRVFLGGVAVDGDVDVPLVSPLPFGATLREAVVTLGATVGPPRNQSPIIAIGGSLRPKADRFQIRALFDGWRAGIVPGHADGFDHGNVETMPLSPMLAAALAINEAFLHVSGEMPSAGRRIAGLDLWDLSKSGDWLSAKSNAPTLSYLPSRLWLLGLGHLGQAYLWGLGLLPYPVGSKVQLLLQDDDVITPSTESTSVLSDGTMLGVKKTRAMAVWAEQRGFEAIINERLFDASVRRRHDEPTILLCGIDNAAGRRALDAAGFDFIVEAGLGRGHQDFRSLLVHTLPAELSSAELWKAEDEPPGRGIEAAAYNRMLKDGSLDQCGVTLLAGKAVGAPFVGAVAATLVLSEVLRLLHGGAIHRLIDMNLVDLAHMRSIDQKRDFSTLNPGFVPVAQY